MAAAGNEWINGYLEAILDAGSRQRGQRHGQGHGGVAPLTTPALPRLLAEAGGGQQGAAAYSPTRYFVEEVVSRFDDRDLHKTWTKVVATRNSQERSNRLENLCWRIWHVARKKKQVEWEYSRQLARRRQEQEQGSREAAEELAVSEGETTTTKDHQQAVSSVVARVGSEARIVSDDEDDDGSKDDDRNLYIVLISIHGLVRGENMELGRDADTGGQVKYVVELARALAATAGVHRVDLLTRQISCPDVDWTYGEPVEMLTHASDDGDGTGGGGAYIVRLPCGPRDKYLPKESLWPHIPEFVDRALAHVTHVARALADQLHPDAVAGAPPAPVWPYVVHGHYADAAEVAAHLASALNVPMVMTGHSLGRNKLEQLLKLGGPRVSLAEIQTTYRIARRVEAEETGLDAAEVVVTSTKQEVEEQWGLYDGFDLMVERKLRVRRRRGVSCLGRYMPRMVVIPPGMDFSYVGDTQEDLAADDGEAELQMIIGGNGNKAKKPLPPIWSEVLRFFANPHKPMILALSRPDPKKNVTTLLKAYGESRHLRELANLTLILGNRDDIEEMSGGAATVLTAVLKLIDRYDLYGCVAYPKHHKQTDVPHIYRLAAKTKGVFINPALVEPFGLTIIEAAAYGLPVVATKNGGPVDIIKALHNGLLVDPHDAPAITEALLSLLADKARWGECRRNGLRNIHRFSWPHHCRLYLSHVAANCDHPAPHQLLRVPASPRGAAAAGRGTDDSLSDSLRGLSISIDASHDIKAGAGAGGDSAAAAIMDALRRRRRSANADNDQQPSSTRAAIGHAPGRRQSLVVVAVDCYDGDGKPDTGAMKKAVDLALSAAAAAGGRLGCVLSTGLTIAEAANALGACGADPAAFDALICSSGAELCYPWKDDVVAADEEYAGHVAFRWPGDHVRAAVPRLGKAEGAHEADVLAVDEAASSVHCHAYAARGGAAKVKKVDSVRQSLRMRGFRCNLVYTRACTRLNVVPLSASRPRALRYLSIQWGVDLAKVAVLVGDKGDTDRERLLPGLHRTLVLPELVNHGSEELRRAEDGFLAEDVVAMDAPNIVTLAEYQAAADILKAL